MLSEQIVTFDQSKAPRIWIRSFYGFGPEEDGYIGWSRKVARDRMLPKLRPGDLVMIYGAGTKETERSQRSYVLGFLKVDATPIMDHEKASTAAIAQKASRGWAEKWTYALPVRRAWRTNEKFLISTIATETHRAKAGQAIGVWGALLTEKEAFRALKIKVTEVTVYGEPPVANGVTNDRLAQVFRPSKAFPGSFGDRISVYEDGQTWLYLTRFEGDGDALLGRANSLGKKLVVVKIGVSSNPTSRIAQLNSGIPPAAEGRWGPPLISEPYPDRKSAEEAELLFKNEAQHQLESLGGEFFRGDWMTSNILFARMPGASRFD